MHVRTYIWTHIHIHIDLYKIYNTAVDIYIYIYILINECNYIRINVYNHTCTANHTFIYA